MGKKITKTSSLSAIVIAKNEEQNIKDCLSSLTWANEIIVIDNGSTDRTREIANIYTKKVYVVKDGTFSTRKNFAYEKTTGNWILFIDADERVTPELKKEILSTIHNLPSTNHKPVFAIPRLNIILGREMTHGGWWPDYAIRLFRKISFKGFKGELHELPGYKGKLGYLKNFLLHKKHNNFSDMVDKTNDWSEIEAKLMFEAGHPKMNLVRFGTAMLREFILRMIKNRAYMDGIEGVMYALYQVYSRFISYAKLWEMQQQEALISKS